MATVDVTVRGGGVFGLSVAWECARRGARVRVIECTRIGAGSSGGVVGALAPHVPEQWNAKKQFQFESLVMAGDFWAGIEQAGGMQTGFARIGRLQPLADDAAVNLARARTAGAEAHWRAKGEWRVAPVTDFGVLAPETPSGWVVHDTLSARANPRQLGPALVAAIRAKGGEIVVGEGADEGAVVWATGVEGLGALSEAFGKQVGNGVKGQAAILEFDAGAAPQVFANGLLVVPHANGTVAVGSTAEKNFDAPDTTDAQLDDVLLRIRALCP
ncbi:NAD(P)/FAD-dependent oxidoreductase, partial [Phaeovulum sp.]|uniref:NAD(P)/FAD-dependent oxidoreductase n=1 Tax=Phaeovulum sp. TaxID=2934796 RepID=UPI00356B4031